MLVTILSVTYIERYHFQSGSIGLLFLTGGVGNCSGSLVAGLVSDRIYGWQRRRKNGAVTAEDRLVPMYVGVPFLVIGFVLYGWFLQEQLHWFTPLVGYLFGM